MIVEFEPREIAWQEAIGIALRTGDRLLLDGIIVLLVNDGTATDDEIEEAMRAELAELPEPIRKWWLGSCECNRRGSPRSNIPQHRHHLRPGAEWN